MQKINLLYVITKLELGGAQKQLLSLISHLDEDAFSIFLFTAGGGLLIKEAEAIKALKLKKSPFLERPLNPIKDILSLIELCIFIKKNKIDIVHTHSSKAGILGRWAARLVGTRIIMHTVHGWSFNDFQGHILRGIFIFLERITATFTDRIIVVSYFDRQKGLQRRIGGPDQYVLIRYGIDYRELEDKNAHIRHDLGLDQQTLLVGMIACFKPQKSPLDFVKLAFTVIKSVPETEVKFILTGDGFLRRKIEKEIKRLGLKDKIILTGWRKDAASIISCLDIYVLTSLWEGLPVTAIEAMAASKPVVATDTGGIAEIISDGKTGFLAKPKDSGALAERLTLLLKNKDLRITMGRNARNCLGFNFTFINTLRLTRDLYKSLIDERRNYAN